MTDGDRRLVDMTNQIARNLATRGDRVAALGTVDHLMAYWAPQMRARLIMADSAALDPIAVIAVALLRSRAGAATAAAGIAPAGGSDAG